MIVKKNMGFSLLEVLIFVSIISLFFIAAASVATVSLRTIKANENKILATRYAEELAEWVRGEKEEDWTVFTTTRMGNWCFSQEPVTKWPDSKSTTNPICPDSQVIGSLFKREMIVELSGERVNASINVVWSEGVQTLSVPIKTVFERFE